MVELVVFIIAGALALIGAVGVVTAKNPVHSALMLVMTLFAMAVLFLNQDAQFLAAVQIIVYAGAIVVVFLFVIMLLGVDTSEDLSVDPIMGQRSLGVLVGVAIAALAVISVWGGATGQEKATLPKVDSITETSTSAVEALPTNQTDGTEKTPNIDQLGEVIFTDYILAFEITALLLTIAVVGAVVLARRAKGELQPIPETGPNRPDLKNPRDPLGATAETSEISESGETADAAAGGDH